MLVHFDMFDMLVLFYMYILYVYMYIYIYIYRYRKIDRYRDKKNIFYKSTNISLLFRSFINVFSSKKVSLLTFSMTLKLPGFIFRYLFILYLLCFFSLPVVYIFLTIYFYYLSRLFNINICLLRLILYLILPFDYILLLNLCYVNVHSASLMWLSLQKFRLNKRGN